MSSRNPIRIAWFGTSIMEHLEGYAPGIFDQTALTKAGRKVRVQSWRNRGYVQRLHLSLQADWPWLDFQFNNYARGGATSRDILLIVRNAFGNQHKDRPDADIAFLACGINDVWRHYQGRYKEAISLEEYEFNYHQLLTLLIHSSRSVVCISEPPVGIIPSVDITAMNKMLIRYNAIAARCAANVGAGFIDVWPAFTAATAHLNAHSTPSRGTHSLWADGVHLSELGDTIILHAIERYLRKRGLISSQKPLHAATSMR